jgi:hypothetical protein
MVNNGDVTLALHRKICVLQHFTFDLQLQLVLASFPYCAFPAFVLTKALHLVFLHCRIVFRPAKTM